MIAMEILEVKVTMHIVMNAQEVAKKLTIAVMEVAKNLWFL